MTPDNSILDEIHAYREAYAKRFNYDLEAMVRDLQEKQLEEKARGRVYVSFSTERTNPDHRESRVTPIHGLRTVVYHAVDLNAAKAWYARALGIAPYFDEPYYVGFRVGGFELGLDPDGKPGNGADNAVAYWGVDDVEKTWNDLLGLGAQPHGEVRDVGGGVKLASVRDPFGNIFGIIENPHFRVEEAK